MKITLLGCGALGQLWLSKLHHQGHDLQGWLRVPHPYCSVKIVNLDGSIFHHHLPANDADHLLQSELLLVTLKAWQVSTALPPLLPKLNPSCAILLLHNGMGTQDELPPHTYPLLQGTTTHAARYQDNHIIHVANGITQIGPVNSQAKDHSRLAKLLHQAMPDVIWHDQILSANWHKLAVNCVINPLTALYDCPNGALESYSQQIELICREVASVMRMEGHQTSYNELMSYVMQVIHNTAENISSMLQDIRAKRHTEIDYITGYLLRCGRSHSIKLPENTRLFEMIKQKEKHNASLSAGLSGSR